MQSLFLTIIPSVTVAVAGADISGTSSGSANVGLSSNTLIGQISVPFEPNTGISLSCLAFGALLFWLVFSAYKTRSVPHLDSSFSLFLVSVTIGIFGLALNSVYWGNHDNLSRFCVSVLIFSICWFLINIIVHAIHYFLGFLAVSDKSKYANRTCRQITNPLLKLWNLLQNLIGFCLTNKKQLEIVAKTLFDSGKALNSMLEALKANNSGNKCPEFQLIISGDTELLKKLPTSPPYDILHFIEIQSLWAAEFNGTQRKMQWRQNEREKQHLRIIENKLAANQRCEKSCAKTLHGELYGAFLQWKEEVIPNYYAQHRNDIPGKMMDKLVLKAIEQWICRTTDNGSPEKFKIVYSTRAIRILFSNSNDLDDSAISFVKGPSIVPPFVKNEIRNIWIPIDDMPQFAYVRDWMNNENSTNWQEKFYAPPCFSDFDGNCLAPAKVVENYVAELNKFVKPRINNTIDIIVNEIESATDPSKYMFLFVGNWMEKKKYHKEPSEYTNRDDSRLQIAERHLAYLSLVLMALYHKKALPLMTLFENVFEKRSPIQNEFDKKARQKTREVRERIQEIIAQRQL